MKILRILEFSHAIARDDPHLLTRKILSLIRKHWKISILVFDKMEKSHHIEELEGKSIGTALRENNITIDDLPTNLKNSLLSAIEFTIHKNNLHKDTKFIENEYKILAKKLGAELTANTAYNHKTNSSEKNIFNYLFISPSDKTNKRHFFIHPDKLLTCEKNCLNILHGNN